MEAHKEHIKILCRVCGKKPKGYVHKKNSDACKGILSSVLGLEVETESEDIYPSGICNSCYLILKRKQNGDIRTTNLSPFTWLPHEDQCQICTAGPSSGGKPKRRKVALEIKGRPSADSVRAILMTIDDLDTPHYAAAPLSTTAFLSTSFLTDLACRKCGCIPNEPVELSTCRHYICVPCIRQSCDGGNTLICDCSDTVIKASDLRPPPPVVVKLYDGLLVICKCGQIVEFKTLKQHLASQCMQTDIPSPSKVTARNLLESTPDSQMQTQTMGFLVDKLMSNNKFLTYRNSSGKV